MHWRRSKDLGGLSTYLLFFPSLILIPTFMPLLSPPLDRLVSLVQDLLTTCTMFIFMRQGYIFGHPHGGRGGGEPNVKEMLRKCFTIANDKATFGGINVKMKNYPLATLDPLLELKRIPCVFFFYGEYKIPVAVGAASQWWSNELMMVKWLLMMVKC